jgi:hypothetical protein
MHLPTDQQRKLPQLGSFGRQQTPEKFENRLLGPTIFNNLSDHLDFRPQLWAIL